MKKLLFFTAFILLSACLSAQATIDLGKKLLNSKESAQIHATLDNDEYVTYYQFQIDTKKKAVVSIEVDHTIFVYKIFYLDNKVVINYRHENKQQLLELEKIKQNHSYNEIHTGVFSTDVTLYSD